MQRIRRLLWEVCLRPLTKRRYWIHDPSTGSISFVSWCRRGCKWPVEQVTVTGKDRAISEMGMHCCCGTRAWVTKEGGEQEKDQIELWWQGEFGNQRKEGKRVWESMKEQVARVTTCLRRIDHYSHSPAHAPASSTWKDVNQADGRDLAWLVELFCSALAPPGWVSSKMPATSLHWKPRLMQASSTCRQGY